MTYSAGQTIAAADYNGFVGSVNTVLTSYGQTNLSTVTAGTSVVTSSGQWAALGANINQLATHQGTTVSSYASQFGAGTTVNYLSTLSNDITSIGAAGNVLSAAAQGTQVVAWTGTTYKAGTTGSGTAAWTLTWTHTLTFTSATAATNFFNAGGVVKVQFGKSSTGNSEDTEWNAFVGAGGVCASGVFLSSSSTAKNLPQGTAKTGTFYTGGSGTPTITNLGYANLTGTLQTIYQQNDSGAAYSSNYVRIQASQNSAGVLTISTVWYNSGAAVNAQIQGGTATNSPLSTWGTAPATVVTCFPPANNLGASIASPSIAVTLATT